MTNDELLHAIALAKAGDTSARNAVIEHCMPTIEHAARRMAERVKFRVERDDFVSAGVLAFGGIIKCFDPARSILFSTFAAYRLRGAMIDYLRLIDPVGRLNRERLGKRSAFESSYYTTHGRPPTAEESLAAVGFKACHFTTMDQPDPSRPASLSQLTYESEGGRQRCVSDNVTDPHAERGVNAADARDLIRHVLQTRGLRPALLLKLRYVDDWTMRRIGTAFTDFGLVASDKRRGRPSNRKTGTLCETRISQVMGELLRDLRSEFAEAA